MQAVKVEIVVSEGKDVTIFKNGTPIYSSYLDKYIDELDYETKEAIGKAIFGDENDTVD